MSDFEVVDRPAPQNRRGIVAPETKALMETLQSGKAISVSLNGRSAAGILARFYNYAKRINNNCVVRTRRIDATHQAYWLENKEP